MTTAKPIRSLSPRERDVAQLLGLGWGYQRVARELGIDAGTVRVHVNRIADKLSNPDELTPLMLVTLWAHDEFRQSPPGEVRHRLVA